MILFVFAFGLQRYKIKHNLPRLFGFFILIIVTLQRKSTKDETKDSENKTIAGSQTDDLTMLAIKLN